MGEVLFSNLGHVVVTSYLFPALKTLYGQIHSTSVLGAPKQQIHEIMIKSLHLPEAEPCFYFVCKYPFSIPLAPQYCSVQLGFTLGQVGPGPSGIGKGTGPALCDGMRVCVRACVCECV